MGPCFQVPFPAEERDRAGFCPFAPSQVSAPTEPALGHLRCHLTDVPPQTNCLPDAVFEVPRPTLSVRTSEHIGSPPSCAESGALSSGATLGKERGNF
ncbi:hypothetical protein TNCV_1132681 [Trichonephila clavipes]|nr:hypothetical protein TNCV_1132681 [Trichonephila clavipes]